MEYYCTPTVRSARTRLCSPHLAMASLIFRFSIGNPLLWHLQSFYHHHLCRCWTGMRIWWSMACSFQFLKPLCYCVGRLYSHPCFFVQVSKQWDQATRVSNVQHGPPQSCATTQSKACLLFCTLTFCFFFQMSKKIYILDIG